jgi:hypothetical protein
MEPEEILDPQFTGSWSTCSSIPGSDFLSPHPTCRFKGRREMMNQMMLIPILCGLFLCSISITLVSAESPNFGPNSAVITNSFCAVQKGDKVIRVHPEANGRRDYKYSDAAMVETVDGVSCLRINEVDTFNAWFSSIWVAQDSDGNVYVLKYYGTENSDPQLLGRQNAFLIMPAVINVGDTISGDEQVVEIGVTVSPLSTGLGPYTGCIKTVQDDGDFVFYAPGVGAVKKTASNDPLRSYELKEKFHVPDDAATFDMITNTLHIPNFQDTYWINFSLINWEPVTLQMEDLGEIGTE